MCWRAFSLSSQFKSVVFVQAVMAAAPIKLLKLEFVIPEEKFEHQIGKAEVTIKQNQDQLAANTNVRDALQKHRVCQLP